MAEESYGNYDEALVPSRADMKSTGFPQKHHSQVPSVYGGLVALMDAPPISAESRQVRRPQTLEERASDLYRFIIYQPRVAREWYQWHVAWQNSGRATSSPQPTQDMSLLPPFSS